MGDGVGLEVGYQDICSETSISWGVGGGRADEGLEKGDVEIAVS